MGYLPYQLVQDFFHQQYETNTFIFHPHICVGLLLSNNGVKDQDAGAVCAGQCGVELAAHSLVAWQEIHEINGKSQVLMTGRSI